MLIRTSSLTTGERLLIDRRRRGETQKESAERLYHSTYRYRVLEAGNVNDFWRGPRIGTLADHEQCLLLRRRSGQSRASAANELGMSEFWYTQMERGRAPVGRLVKFWTRP